jgi:glycine/D-amino acid oxidase-like deaminating enzyme/nitrite reductase/ring-hydroxylating ferredoxin subunit
MDAFDTTSYWSESGPLPRFAALDRDITVDVAVIGGGITGITAAYLLKKSGRTVALLDRRRLASVDTGHTTAHVTYVTDVGLAELEKNLGRDHAQAAWDAGRAAQWQIEANVEAEEIECGFRWVNAWLHAPVRADGNMTAQDFQHEAALASELGFEARLLDKVPFMDRPGIEFTGQALFHPRQYLRGLAEAIPGNGSHVFEHTNADEVEDSPLTVVAGGHRISCDYLVIATHTPLVGRSNIVAATVFQTKLALYTTYAVGGKLPTGVVPPGSYFDTADPYDYLRVDPHRGYDYAILGGEDHKTGQVSDPRECYGRLEERMRALNPEIEITHRWSGQVIETPDGLPFIGESAERQFVATGFSGNGMTFGTLSAMMAVDAAAGRLNPWKDLFDPHRTGVKGGVWDYIRENKDYPYYLVRDRFSGSEGKSLRALPTGEGRILELGGKRVAAYRDESGRVTKLSPVCTHMACLVAWNPAERTWDCPCHGSRFDPTGKVLSGPAEAPLSRVEE